VSSILNFNKLYSVLLNLFYSKSIKGGATGRTGEDTSPPILFKVNFLICPNPVRKMGGGGGGGGVGTFVTSVQLFRSNLTV
jgi:hypothetical protein